MKTTHRSWSRSGVEYIDNVAIARRENIVRIAVSIEEWRMGTPMTRVRWDRDHRANGQDAIMVTVSHKLPLTMDTWVLLLIHRETADRLRGSDEPWDPANTS